MGTGVMDLRKQEMGSDVWARDGRSFTWTFYGLDHGAMTIKHVQGRELRQATINGEVTAGIP